MSEITSNLELVKPDIDDNIYQTIMDLASNFQKIADNIPVYVDAIPTSGDWPLHRQVLYKTPVSGGYIGAVNVRAGKAAPKWESLKNYNVGDVVVPVNDNGHYYTCVQSGKSGFLQPDFKVATQTITDDTKNGSVWQPSKYYNINDIVFPTVSNNRFYLCTVPGTSSVSEPTWATTDGVATSDNQVVWVTYKIVKWQESGTAAYFKNFGKIE